MKRSQRLISTVAATGVLLCALPLAAQGDANTDHFRTDLESRVMVKLIADTELEPIGVDAKAASGDGNITLTGKMPDQASRERALTVAKSVDGVTSIDNQLSVGDS